MSIKLWNTDINWLFLWSTAINQAYLWNTEIFKIDLWWWDLTDAVYDNISFVTWNEDTSPRWIYFKTDWTKMYVLWDSANSLYQYTLSTPWLVSSASYDSISLSTSPQWESSPYWVYFKSDGLNLYIVWLWKDTVYQYTLSTAWDLSTATYANKSFNVAQSSQAVWVSFKTDWTKMYVSSSSPDSIFEYDLSVAWDVSTASYDNVTISLSSEDTVVIWVFFKTDWTRFYIVWRSNDTVFQYDLSTAWDLSTTSYNSISLLISWQDTVPTWIAFKPDWKKMYVTWDINNSVFQYSL